MRGPDISYCSYDRLPRGPVPDDYGEGTQVPELVVEVRSPSDRWPEVLAKAAEYLKANVLVVVVLDPETESALVVTGDQPPRRLDRDEELSVPEVLEEFQVPVRRFFA